MRALQVWTALYPRGIAPGQYREALMMAEIATQAEKAHAKVAAAAAPVLKAPEPVSVPAPAPSRPAIVPSIRLKGTMSPYAFALHVNRSPQSIYDNIKRGRLKARKTSKGLRITAAEARRWQAEHLSP
jgi:hypothetical protein